MLLDYPYIYPLDPNKLFCTHIDPRTNMRCTGMIDYDDGFNHLYCRKCGKRYLAVDLQDNNPSNDIITTRGGIIPMKIRVIKGDGTVHEPIRSSTVITDSTQSIHRKNNVLKVTVTGGSKKAEEKPVEPKIEFPKSSEDPPVLDIPDTPQVETNQETEPDQEVEKDKEPKNETEPSTTTEPEPSVVETETEPEPPKPVENEVAARIEDAGTEKYPKKSSSKKSTSKSGGAKKAGGAKTSSGVGSKFIPSPETSD